jgi:hypothetical protein
VSADHIVTTPSLGFPDSFCSHAPRGSRTELRFRSRRYLCRLVSELVAANGVATNSEFEFMSRKVEIARNITREG